MANSIGRLLADDEPPAYTVERPQGSSPFFAFPAGWATSACPGPICAAT
jgi:hypothetical protein